MSEYTWLIDGYCHLVSETFLFIENYFEGVVPAGRPDEDIYRRSKELYDRLNEISEAGAYEVAIQRAGIEEPDACGTAVTAAAHEQQRFMECLGAYLEFATEYFERITGCETVCVREQAATVDCEKLLGRSNIWKAPEQDRRICRNTVLNTVQMIANLTVCLAVLDDPHACQIKSQLGLDDAWQVHSVHSGYCIKSL